MDLPVAGRAVGVFSDYSEMLAAIRNRVHELGIAGTTFDQFAGLPDGYLSKHVGERPVRRIGMVSMGPLFRALGVYCVVVVDPEATARLKDRVQPRNGSFVRAAYTQQIVTNRQWRRDIQWWQLDGDRLPHYSQHGRRTRGRSL